MGEDAVSMNPEKMYAPSYKLLVTAPMAAIMMSGKAAEQWPVLLESIAPIYAAAAEETGGDVKEALLTVASVLRGGDASIRQFFSDDALDFGRLMEISAAGADFWMCKLSDTEVNSRDLVSLFQAIQAGLIQAVGDVREENPMIEQLIETQDKIIEHIGSLN